MQTYESIDAINWSSLKHVDCSPKVFKHRQSSPRSDTEAMLVGRASHVRVLQPELYASIYATAPECDRRTREGKATWADFVSRCMARTSLTAKQGELVERIASSVESHPLARSILGASGRREHVVTWTDQATGVACKARLDLLTPTYVADLKSARSVKPRAFASAAATMLYHGQMAWYHDGAVTAGLLAQDAEPPWIVAVSTAEDEAYDVACYRVDGQDLEAGRKLYRGLLDKLVICQTTDMWPGMAPDALPLNLPPWAPGMSELYAEPVEDDESW